MSVHVCSCRNKYSLLSDAAVAVASNATPGADASNPTATLECPICLQTCIHPARLPCGHIFCFLCVKVGVAPKTTSPSRFSLLCCLAGNIYSFMSCVPFWYFDIFGQHARNACAQRFARTHARGKFKAAPLPLTLMCARCLPALALAWIIQIQFNYLPHSNIELISSPPLAQHVSI